MVRQVEKPARPPLVVLVKPMCLKGVWGLVRHAGVVPAADQPPCVDHAYEKSVLQGLLWVEGCETASQRRRRYMSSELSEVSDPETWMLHNHHSDMEEDEPEGEPRGDVPRGDARERTQTYDSRIFLMFTMIVDQKYGQWGRRHQPHFAWEIEAENWTTDDALLKTFNQMRVMALCLDNGKLPQVEEMLQLIEEDGDNERILAGLNRLENELDSSLDMEMTLQESIAWLYHRYRDRMVGQRYDKIRWAGDVFSSPEESMRVSQERALEAIEHRMEIAYILNEQDEYAALENYRDRIGML